jgi:hypothetical protein
MYHLFYFIHSGGIEFKEAGLCPAPGLIEKLRKRLGGGKNLILTDRWLLLIGFLFAFR